MNIVHIYTGFFLTKVLHFKISTKSLVGFHRNRSNGYVLFCIPFNKELALEATLDHQNSSNRTGGVSSLRTRKQHSVEANILTKTIKALLSELSEQIQKSCSPGVKFELQVQICGLLPDKMADSPEVHL